MTKLQIVFGMAAVMFCIGCGGGSAKNYPLKGKVTVKGGAPVPRGTVSLSSGKSGGTGQIKPDGTYVVEGGLPAGKYKVMLQGTAAGPTYDKPNEPVVPVVDKKYETGETTPLTAEIEAKENVKDFTELDPAS